MWRWLGQTFSQGLFKQVLNLHIQESVTLLNIQACFLQQITDTEHVIFCGFIWWQCWASRAPGARRWALPLAVAWHRCARGLSVKQTDGGNELCEEQVFTALLRAQPPLAACPPAHTAPSSELHLFLINTTDRLSHWTVEHLICLSSFSPALLELLLHGSCLFLFIPSQRLTRFSSHSACWHQCCPCSTHEFLFNAFVWCLPASWEQQVVLERSSKAWLPMLHIFLGMCLQCCSMVPLPFVLWLHPFPGTTEISALFSPSPPLGALCFVLESGCIWNIWSFQPTFIKGFSSLALEYLPHARNLKFSFVLLGHFLTPAQMVKTILVFLLGIYYLLKKVPSWV